MSDEDQQQRDRSPAGPVEVNRREALELMSVAGLAAAAAGCLRGPGDQIVPYVEPPERRADESIWFATSMVVDGFATGLLARSHSGRPTKLDGNPRHPASLGGTSARHQASIFDLYDPARAQTATLHRRPASPLAWLDELGRAPGPLWLVAPPQSSPAVAALLARLRERRGGTRVVWHDPVGHESAYLGAKMVFGRPLERQLRLRRADRVLSLDADFLGGMPMSPAWARDFAARRRLESPLGDPGRLYVVEPMPSCTGALADDRLRRPAGDVTAVALLLLHALGRAGRSVPPLPEAALAAARRRLDDPAALRFVDAVAADLIRHAGACAVVVGDRQPPVAHALGCWLDLALGDVGRTVSFTEPALIEPLASAEPGRADLQALVDAARAGAAGAVVIIDCNPVYSAPPRLQLATALARVPVSVHATTVADETSRACKHVLPISHYLEAWGDARAWDGTRSFVQPLVRPLYDTPSALEIWASLAGLGLRGGRELVREQTRSADIDALLGLGFDPGSAAPPVTVAPAAEAGALPGLLAAVTPPEPLGTGLELELDLALSPSVHDGRWFGNAWLQELPHPITKQSWGHAALLGPRTAARLGVEDGRVVRIAAGSREVELAAVVEPDHAEGAVTIELGYGRAAPLPSLAENLGASGFRLLGAPGPGAWLIPHAVVRATSRRQPILRTQHEFEQHDREVALAADLGRWRRNPDFTAEHRGPLPTLLGRQPAAAAIPQWAMTIDTTICNGCQSCVVSCQAENNIPTVGPRGVAAGREMHWLRIDRYRLGFGGVVHQPMLCQHCEHAPCEYVCPVFATAHSPDGLNEMTYNRCIGTRFCSNNCPYKVRRFNWFDYTGKRSSKLALQRNPQVTVRGRGVMEKCTYCVQRIRGAEIRARMEERAIRPGEVVTACQQACPTGAIQFGALEHAETPMARWRRESRAYAVLHELGTRPRTLYLAKIDNPNPALRPEADGAEP